MTYDGLLAMRNEITSMKSHIRRTNNTIPDQTISFVFDSAFQNFKKMARQSCRNGEITLLQKNLVLLSL